VFSGQRDEIEPETLRSGIDPYSGIRCGTGDHGGDRSVREFFVFVAMKLAGPQVFLGQQKIE